MHKFGFFHRTRSRDIYVACPCCKNHAIFNNPEYNYDEFNELSRLSNNVIHFEKHSYTTQTVFFGDDDTSSTSTLVTEEAPNSPGIINSTNSHSYKDMFSGGQFYLKFPYEKGFLMKCRLCNEEALYYEYHPGVDLPSAFYTGMSVDEDYKRIHVNIKGYFVTTFNQKVQAHYYMTRIVFNKRTGRVTVLQPLGPNNRPLSILPKYSPMWNVTYGRTGGRRDLKFINNEPYILNDYKEKVVPLLLKALQERFPYVKDDHFDDCFSHIRDENLNDNMRKKKAILRTLERFHLHDALKLTIRKYRFHDLPIQFLNSIKSDNESRTKILSRVGYLSSHQVSDLVKLVGRKLPKTLRKEAMKSIDALYFIKRIDFIKSSSNMVKLVEKFAKNNRFDFDNLSFFSAAYLEALKIKNQDNFNNEDKLYEHCETILVNRLISESGHYLNDTCYMYKDVVTQAEYTIDTELSFRQLHDDLSGAQRKLSSPNRELTYTEKEQEIEWEYGPYKFSLANDTHFLIDVGAAMDICVGGYGDRAHRKSLHIVVVSSPENPYECCIEMSGSMKSVEQAKIKYNKKPQGELLEAIQNWIGEKKLLINTYDLPREEVITEQHRAPLQRMQLQPVQFFDDDEEEFEMIPLAVAE